MEDKGKVVVPRDCALAIRIENSTVRPQVGFYQDGHLVPKFDPADLEVALSFNNQPTEIHWLVLLADLPEDLPDSGWSYDAVILADGTEARRFEVAVPKEGNSHQKCEIVPEEREEGEETNDS